MEKTDEKLASLIEKLQEAGFTHAPEVIDGAIRAMYYDGVVQLGASAFFSVFLVVSVCSFFLAMDKEHETTAFISFFGTVLCFFGAAFTLLIGNPWLLVFDPEAAFYQQLMSGIIK